MKKLFITTGSAILLSSIGECGVFALNTISSNSLADTPLNMDIITSLNAWYPDLSAYGIKNIKLIEPYKKVNDKTS